VEARHRVGNGPAGNVGREAITSVVIAGTTLQGITLTARNPLAARGGIAPESMADARELVAAPLRHEIQRAITSDDYETIAEREVAGLQNASAELLWNGSWYEAHVALDPLGRDGVDDVMRCRATRVLERVRRIGHDLEIAAAEPVPLWIKLHVCARPGHLRVHVRTAVVRAVGECFRPDDVTFGEPVLLSRIVAKVAAVQGVGSVRVERFERLFVGNDGELEQGFIPLGRREIARLDNDPVRPENGILDVMVEGGR
jgi:predicted phage baseplate assembly protein